MPAPVIALVIPVFNEVAVLPELFARLTRCSRAARLRWSAVLVDDGSRDRSAALVRAQAAPIRASGSSSSRAISASKPRYRPGSPTRTRRCSRDDGRRPAGSARGHPRAGRRVARGGRRRARHPAHARETGLRRAGFDLFHAFSAG